MARMFIPVRLGRCRSSGTDDFTGRPPVVRVHIAADSAWNANRTTLPAHNRKTYVAMIDTGAEATAIDTSAAVEVHAQAKHRATVHAMNATTSVPGADVQIIFPSHNLVFAARAAVINIRGVGNNWDLILGRSFLQYCHLQVDGPRGLYQLEWIGPAS
jgi:hypothetical protein